MIEWKQFRTHVVYSSIFAAILCDLSWKICTTIGKAALHLNDKKCSAWKNIFITSFIG